MSETQQRTIFGDPITANVTIQTTGRTLRPWKRMVDQVSGEYRIQFNEDTVRIQAVNPGNTIAIYTELEATAFDEYELDGETLIGIRSDDFGSALQHARYGKSTDDAITLAASDEHLETDVTRPIGGTTATLSERVGLVDPHSVRQQPDIPELDLGVSVTLPPETIIQTIKRLDTSSSDDIKLGSGVETVVFKQDSDTTNRYISLECSPSEASEFTHYSPDYVEKIATALRHGYVDDVTLQWDEDFPLLVDFERDDVYRGTIMLAPRIKNE